jgi:CubicO group peptidase (beta-lactamase class C family)
MYSTGASVAGVLCARTANQPFPHVLSTRVFEPLGMRDTGFFTTAIERPATSYQPAPDGLIVRDPPDGARGRPERVF